MEVSEHWDSLALTVGKETTRYSLQEAERPVESQSLIYETDDLKIIGTTTAKAALGEYPLLQILLYEDRVFWPCEAIEQPFSQSPGSVVVR